MIRLLICGGRDWAADAEKSKLAGHWVPDPDEVLFTRSEIARYAFKVGSRDNRKLTVIHGACPTGADKIAEVWAIDAGAKVEPYPADWTARGKSAGPRRNEQMAQAGADLCLAFWDGESRGTLDMITRAVKHGIPVRVVPMRRKK